MINSEQEYNDSMQGAAEYEQECYQDLEENRLWTATEMIDKLIFLAHEIGNDQIYGSEVRKELKKYDGKMSVEFIEEKCEHDFDKPIPKRDGSGFFEYRCPKCGKLEEE